MSNLGLQKVYVSQILEDDAIIHLGKAFTDMFTLTDRIHQYLRNKGAGTRVPKSLLKQRSAEHGFTSKQFDTAIKDLETLPDIGRLYEDGIVLYCWYSLTDEEKETHRKQLAFWNALP